MFVSVPYNTVEVLLQYIMMFVCLLAFCLFVCLFVCYPCQVFLLEEEGYLGYVDGLSHMKHFAPDLVRGRLQKGLSRLVKGISYRHVNPYAYIHEVDG